MLKHFFHVFIICAVTLSYGQFGFQRSAIIDIVKDSETQKFGWAGGLDYCQFSNIDLDFDGVEDLFVFDRTCNKILTFLQKGGPGEIDYEYAPEYEDDFPEGLHDWALLVDYDCDGKKDLFTYLIGGASVYRNVGDAESGNSFELVEPILQTFIYDSYTYMYFSAQDISAITDIDGDGDVDILGFGVLGTAVEYHKNMSMELYGTCDSLEFETKNICWGRFRESVASNEVTLWDTLNYPCRNTDLGDELPVHSDGHQDRHVGSTVLALDMDNSGVMDLILGDAAYSTLTLLMNSGTEVNTNSGMDEQDNAFPSTSVSVDLPIFPGAYHVDINNDNIRDLLVSPASKVSSQNVQSVWRYNNEGADTEPDFIYQEQDFLQNEMIDVGTSSYPVLFDHDGDGLKDLLVSSQGQYNPETGNQISKIAYYHNSGTAEAPEFTYVTDDYQNISTIGIGTSLVFYPAFGDLDGDGDEDMILGEFSGYCHYMENTGGAGSPAVFTTFDTLRNNEGTFIFDGTYAFPNLTDLDRDGDLDLIIGRRSGKLHYYQNTGVDGYNFEYVTNNLGNIDVSAEGSIEGLAIPEFVEVDGEYHLIVGSKTGRLYYYDAIEEDLEGAFHFVSSKLDNIDIGSHSAPAVYNLNGDDKFEMILGNRRGGVVLFESAETELIGLESFENQSEILIYPNPAQDQLFIALGDLSYNQLQQTKITVYSLTGQAMIHHLPFENLVKLNLSNLAKGTYVVEVSGNNQTKREKLIIQ